MVLATKVRLGPRQVKALKALSMDGMDVLTLFATPCQKPGPYSTIRYAGAMGIKRLAQGHNSKAQWESNSQLWVGSPRLQPLHPCTHMQHTCACACTRTSTHAHACACTHACMHTCTYLLLYAEYDTVANVNHIPTACTLERTM